MKRKRGSKAELLRRLQEYKRFKEVSFKLDEMPRIDRDIFPASGKLPNLNYQNQRIIMIKMI